MTEVRWHSDAYAELIGAAGHYEDRRAGLGDEFLAEVDRSVEMLRASPNTWPLISDRSRRIRTNRFPYGLIYQIRPDVIRVIAVMHLHRRPGYWRDREI